MLNHTTYDYVIVGGGSAGCVLAARLSEDPQVQVLLLEAGPSDWHPMLRIPLCVGKLRQANMYDWGFFSQPQTAMGGRRIQLLRGKVLGGSSSVNFMAHNRGNRSDYERWVRLGLPQWSYDHLLPYFKRSEAWREGGDAPHRGREGPVGVTYTCRSDPVTGALLQAALAVGHPRCEDLNGPEPLGFGLAQSAIDQGRRASTSQAYLRPVRSRKNLTVLTKALACRIVLEGTRAVGVEYLQRGVACTARARREVILSSGALNSPQLLMLSGIGDAPALRAHGIEAKHHLPGVGANLQDHLSVGLIHQRIGEESALHRMLRADRLVGALLKAYCKGQGPATVLPSGVNAILRSQAGLDAPDMQIMFGAGALEAKPWWPGINDFQDQFYLRPVVSHPLSRGTVRLASADPRQRPLVDPRYLCDPHDVRVLRDGLRIVRDIVRQPSMAPFRGPELAPGPDCTSDSQLDAYVRATATTVQHASCTCRMGEDEFAVVDPELRVRGLSGLRVVDASVMPEIVSCNIHAVVLAIAERAADLILGRAAGRAEPARAAAPGAPRPTAEAIT